MTRSPDNRLTHRCQSCGELLRRDEIQDEPGTLHFSHTRSEVETTGVVPVKCGPVHLLRNH